MLDETWWLQQVSATHWLLNKHAFTLRQTTDNDAFRRSLDEFGDREPIALVWENMPDTVQCVARSRGVTGPRHWAIEAASGYWARHTGILVKLAKTRQNK